MADILRYQVSTLIALFLAFLGFILAIYSYDAHSNY